MTVGPAGLEPFPVTESALGPVDEWRRLSPKMLLVHPVKEIGRFLPALVILLLAGGSGTGELWSLVGVGFVTLLALSRWFTTRYRIDSDQVQIREGLVRRRTLAARLDRVRTVDVTSHALHRALGLARVEIGTGVSDKKGKSALRLDGLPAGDAARLRAELLHRLPVNPVAIDPVAAPSGEEELVRFDPSWIRYAPFTLSGVFTGLAILGFGWKLVSQDNINPERFGATKSVAHQLDGVSLWVATIEVVIGVLVFIAIASTVRYLLQFWNFRLTRHSSGSLHISRGLLTTRATSIETSRMRGVGISQTLLMRWVGGGRMVAIATGLEVGRGSSRGGTVLMPDAPIAQVRAVGARLVGDSDMLVAPLVSHGPVARRRRYTRALAGAAGLVGVAALLTWLSGLSWWDWTASLVLLPIALPLAADRARGLGHLVRDGRLVTQSGTFARRRGTFETAAIIGWNVKQSFFQRRAGVATLVATTAAGKQKYTMRDLPESDVVSVAESAVPGLLAPFAY